MTKIAVLSDIHEYDSLEAVLADAKRQKVDEYWLWGIFLCRERDVEGY